MKWMVTGDTHGTFTRFANLPEEEEIGMIVLGDFGINFYLNKTDIRKKKEICANYPNITFYCVRGNHEARPQDIPGMTKQFDENVHGTVYYEPEYPNIRYFLDYGFYDINGYTCLIIGGAYSVDKHWRLERVMLTEEINNPKKSGWFNNEQLSKEEMEDCLQKVKLFSASGKTIDFIMTHTCPYSYQPRDMFLGFIDQSTVDNSMELWLDEIGNSINWNYWLFGHYHADRLECPHVEQYFNNIESLDDIVARWKRYDTTGEIDWWLNKSPNFYKED